ncbi:MAG: SUMF1/EgtB/PvdO family nonheme iron enzyme, partial [Bacteroidaceae bacterium]|nr:SUMF1/EgtB/PvdO family nonheme iron enzyme [Bacteroidaceae bacterium]
SFLPVGTYLARRYRIVAPISRGGFGFTYKAIDTKMVDETSQESDYVVIKEFFQQNVNVRNTSTMRVAVNNSNDFEVNSKLRKGFIREARRMYKLRHPNIVRVSDFIEDENGTSYYIMDYVEGEPLSSFIRNHGALSEDFALKLIRQLLDALSYVHQQHHLLHLDIKPSNLMFDGHDHIVLIDFGASKIIVTDPNDVNHSTILSHTKGYAPIEQNSQSLHLLEPRTDLYAVGATLYHMLTGVRPPECSEISQFDKPSSAFALKAPLPPSVSARTVTLINRLMAFRIVDRPANAQTVLNYLDDREADDDSIVTLPLGHAGAWMKHIVEDISTDPQAPKEPLTPKPQEPRKTQEQRKSQEVRKSSEPKKAKKKGGINLPPPPSGASRTSRPVMSATTPNYMVDKTSPVMKPAKQAAASSNASAGNASGKETQPQAENNDKQDGCCLGRLILIVGLLLALGFGVKYCVSNQKYSLIEDEETSEASSALFEKIYYDFSTSEMPKFVFQKVEGGTFDMGATPGQGSDANYDEKPVHQVTLSSFYIGAYEVTQAQYEEIMGDNPSVNKGNNRPVECVSWDDCQTFIEKLNARKGDFGVPSNMYFRLPTEAEWEYAAREGQKSHDYKYSGSDNVDEVAWYENNSGGQTHDVGLKKPNELGLYDMSGNVWEWCSDRYNESYYASSPSTNPTGASSDQKRVRRGGSRGNYGSSCRVSYRFYSTPTDRRVFLGFRLVLAPK